MNLSAKYLFFDLDDTLTPNKTPMEDDMYELLRSLPHTKVIVSGANVYQIIAHTRNLPLHKLGQNGNHAVNVNNVLLWEERFSQEELEAIKTHIARIKEHTSESIDVADTVFFNHGAQVSFSLLKPGTDITKKERFDPGRTIRTEILKATPFCHHSVDVTVAGASSFDYLPRGKHKGFYVKKFIDCMGWDKDECLYFGDSFYLGGNDEPVKGVIETIPVRNRHETYKLLTNFKQ